MQIVFAAFAALAGVVAVLAGAYGLHRTRHITRSGRYAIALVKPPPPGAERPVLMYETHDGRIVETVSPVSLPSGSSVRLRYDPADPREVVVDGRERTATDRGFMIVGCVLVVAALALAVVGGREG
ncbi:DUF3592 domain-containing protein [Streptomyces clavuligerus]|uniref:DUF3592 domain-containing protein n=1 Tax=Streptomyces clavuligerus TaxID=1901 RepID=B5GXL1_STRCL|nr:DUF3592 domain-containing protein [Streptomyces clavuligerus]ANW20716.1 hypothetical protein BB341_22160 [Streptomyces clavuligerus]AXU15343.1 hypothetical protein D1794_23050 [Streptomyces clavuligerus]EDY51057.1 hypothetical protein SSCG_04031 [Streptomyces clavuligerus]EFG06260.1 Hypothetical protein SCLAV_1182 [Streptomyces clavuligerus]MBY6305432.1 hypothetical protein [Streptomyces clavuligerus]